MWKKTKQTNHKQKKTWTSLYFYQNPVCLHQWAKPYNGRIFCMKSSNAFLVFLSCIVREVGFAVISHTLAFKTWQKKKEHLILHSLAHTGEKQLPGMQLMLKTYLSRASQPVLLYCRKQTLEGNSHNSRFQPAGNFARKPLSNGNKACLSKQR